MVFSSMLFAFYFLPVVCLLYFLARERYRNYLLLVASLLFYAYGEPRFVFIMLGSIFVNYVLALMIQKAGENKSGVLAKLLLVLGIIFNLGILFLYKYSDYSISLLNRVFKTNIPIQNIVLPIGISFFTFQALSYVIDVYRQTVPAQKNPFYLALYISFFPQLIAGPIVRYSTIESQIKNRTHTVEKVGEGAKRFLLGFCKKVILANNFSVVSTAVFEKGDSVSAVNPLLLWIGAISFSLQIFYDFSGYSDMAIGLGKIFGFEFEENFNYPYIPKSITEFWRRWHISLSKWFRDYVYIPLGGSKVSVPRHVINLLIVWGLTGIWHGANSTFIFWGIGYFALLVIEKYIVKPEQRKNWILRIFWQIVTLACVNFGWVIFNSSDIQIGIKYCLAMVGYYGVRATIDPQIIYYLREYGFFIAAGILFSTPAMKKLNQLLDKSLLGGIAGAACYGVLFLWAVSFLILGVHNPFLYFNF